MTTEIIGKTCNGCGLFKLFSEYTKHKNGKYGFRSACKACTNAVNTEWRRRNPEASKAATKAWQDAHPERTKQNELVSLNSKIETLKQALLEVIKVLESDDSAIVDTVWVSTGQPETLRDHCHHAVYGYLHEGEERA